MGSYMFDPTFWFTNAVLGLFVYLCRFPMEIAHWKIHKWVRRTADHLAQTDPAAADYWLTEFEDAPRPFRLFIALRLRRALRSFNEPPRRPTRRSGHTVDSTTGTTDATSTDADVVGVQVPRRVEGGEASVSEPAAPAAAYRIALVEAAQRLGLRATRSGVDGRIERDSLPHERAPKARFSALARRWASRLASRMGGHEALIKAVIRMAGTILGGDEGKDFVEEQTAYIRDEPRMRYKLYYAASTVWGAIRMRADLTGVTLQSFVRRLLVVRSWETAAAFLVSSPLLYNTATAALAVSELVLVLLVGGWYPATWFATPIAVQALYVMHRVKRWVRSRSEAASESSS